MPSLDARVQAALLRAGYASGGVKLVVAVSGGPDSMALMHLLTVLKETARLELHVAHLNHDFRGEEAFVDAAVRGRRRQRPGAALHSGGGRPGSVPAEVGRQLL